MLLDRDAHFDITTFTPFGKEMDGWETRRKRTRGHDFSLILLSAPTKIKQIDIDTAYFTGNYPPHASIQGITWSGLIKIGAEIKKFGGARKFLEQELPGFLFEPHDCYSQDAIKQSQGKPFSDAFLQSLLDRRPASDSEGLTEILDLFTLLVTLRQATILERARGVGIDQRTKAQEATASPNSINDYTYNLGRMGTKASEGEWRLALALFSQYWPSLIEWTPLKPGYPETRHNLFDLSGSCHGGSSSYFPTCDEPIAMLRVNMGPDGGIARLRVFGDEQPAAAPSGYRQRLQQWKAIGQTKDLSLLDRFRNQTLPFEHFFVAGPAGGLDDTVIFNNPRPTNIRQYLGDSSDDQPFIPSLTSKSCQTFVRTARGTYKQASLALIDTVNEKANVGRVVSKDELEHFTEFLTKDNKKLLYFSNSHYGTPMNTFKAEPGLDMGDGWETARALSRPYSYTYDENKFLSFKSSEFFVIKFLDSAYKLFSLEVDTNYFTGNNPESILIEVASIPTSESSEAQLVSSIKADSDTTQWQAILPRTRLRPGVVHTFCVNGDGETVNLANLGAFNAMKVTIYPDGGIIRFKGYGQEVQHSRL